MISRHCSDEQLRTNEIEDLSGEEREIAALLKIDGVDWSCLCGAYSCRKDAEAVVAEFVRRPMNTVLTWQRRCARRARGRHCRHGLTESAARRPPPRSTYRPPLGFGRRGCNAWANRLGAFRARAAGEGGRVYRSWWPSDFGRWCVLERARVSWRGRLAKRRKMAFPPRETGIPPSGHREPCVAM
jgi:hypothetical protein